MGALPQLRWSPLGAPGKRLTETCSHSQAGGGVLAERPRAGEPLSPRIPCASPFRDLDPTFLRGAPNPGTSVRSWY